MAQIEINGQVIEAREGAMVIEAADEAGIHIPRFCYHKKLSIAANCRMCLVEVEKVGKPLPACATPVTDGMKIFTKSPKAIAAQKGVMEFLLINHPLDCPICDQGGECELQDIAMGYGGDSSHYYEGKRVVLDKNLGPLISTELTRCIHCTRCVRFGEEIAGFRELGATGRGQHMEIGTYIGKSVNSELSGNIIDLCPVGALTSKPFRFSARSWEMSEYDGIAPHDCLGSNVHLHVAKQRIKRVVPKENESINETWISDRDRFSYEALYSNDRLSKPLIKVSGVWQETDWESALEFTVRGLRSVMSQSGSSKVGALASASCTVEELYLFQKLMRDLEINNLDHRVRCNDFEQEAKAPIFPSLGVSIEQLEKMNSVLLIGSNIRQDQPIACHRLRKASFRDAKIMAINAVDYDFHLSIYRKSIVSPAKWLDELASVAKAVINVSGQSADSALSGLLDSVGVKPHHESMAKSLLESPQSLIILGPQAINHSHGSSLAALTQYIAKVTDSKFGYLTEGSNTSGAWLCGVLPHRGPAGVALDSNALNAQQMFDQGLSAYVLMNMEPELEAANPSAANSALVRAEFVISLSSYKSPQAEQYANVILPIAAFAENDGTFINVEGRWQSFKSVVPPFGDSKPAWKIFRVIGNYFDLVGYDFTNVEQVREEIAKLTENVTASNINQYKFPKSLPPQQKSVVRVSELQMYAGDAIQRRAKALHATSDAAVAAFYMNEVLAKKYGLNAGDQAVASQQGTELVLPVKIDNRVADDCILLHSGLLQTAALDGSLTDVTLAKA